MRKIKKGVKLTKHKEKLLSISYFVRGGAMKYKKSKSKESTGHQL
jgi:hypothetical protein